jgi:protein O-GlcNAc transferase
MMSSTQPNLFDRAKAHLESGQHNEAIALLQQLLASDPHHAEGLFWLGTLASMSGRHEQAIDLLRRAIAVKPDSSPTYCTLGISLAAVGKLQEAIAAYHRAIELEPSNAEAYINLGCTLVAAGQYEPAIAALRKGLTTRPELGQAYVVLSFALRSLGRFDEAIAAANSDLALRPNSIQAIEAIGLALMDRGRPDLAIEQFQRALAIDPRSFDTLLSLATACKFVGRFDEAVAAYQSAIKLRPNVAALYNDLGDPLLKTNHPDEAKAAWQKAIAIDPRYPEAHYNMGLAASAYGQFDEAIACYQRAVEYRGDYVDAWVNLGNAYRHSGRIDQALDCYDRALALRPDIAMFDSHRLFALHYHPDWDAAALLREHREWNKRHAAPLAASIKPHSNSRIIDRRIRIGYISPYFREHVIGFSMLPLLVHHDRKQFEIVCYSSTLRPDGLTPLIRKYADRWHNIAGIGDREVAKKIRAEEIDILVDLNVHSYENHLLVFARKPAPVQVSYLGYCSTTGMDAMDYRLSDAYFDPPDADLSCYSEQTIRLAGTYWCYAPTERMPDVVPLPALASGSITFGCLNNFCKVTSATQNLWAQLLQAVPRSRLLVHVPVGDCSEQFRQRFESLGISRERLILVPRESWGQYINRYHQIDIALDPFPYGGGITTLDGMYMGVPAVTLNGRTAVGRGGASILSHAGLSELIAETPGQYIEIAAALAGDLPRLQHIRATLRHRMRQSPLMDAPRYARDVEAASRQMWRQWCERNDP